MMNISPKPIALVTGAAHRTGRALAESLGLDRFTVWVHYDTSAEAAEEVADSIERDGGRVRLVRGDLTRPDQTAAIIDRIAEVDGRMDVLVNNVGIYRTGPLAEYDREDYRQTLAANVLGPFDLIRRSLPLFRAYGGNIINIGAAGIDYNGAGGKAAAYYSSKAALLVLTRSFAEELGPRGIRVNMISPGHIDNSVDIPPDFAETVPLRRAATTLDICNAMRWLIDTRRAGYITGQNIQVDGGMMLGLRADRW